MNQENFIFSLIKNGWYCCDAFLNPALCQNLIQDLHSLPLRSAKIGRGRNEQSISSIRNDSIFWLDDSGNSEAQKNYVKEMNQLMAIINKELYLGLKQFEGHFARYEPSGFYKKHLDQFSDNKERIISIITYLNTPNAGGELRLYSRDNPELIEIDIKPKAGSLVCFLSNQIYHEVLPTTSERLSIAGWFRTTIL